MIDQELLEEIQYAVIEPPDGGQSWPSNLWTRAEVLGYVSERQDRLIRETHMIVAEEEIEVVSPYGVRHPLPTDWMVTVRITWGTTTIATRELCRSDSWEADHGLIDWPLVAGQPKVYMDGDATPLTLQIAPLPIEDGTITVQYVPSCPPLTGDGTDLAVAPEFTPTIKYGALSDMLSKVGRANDASRAEYCSNRFTMGVEIAQLLLKGFK